MKMIKDALKLYLVTDRTFLNGRSLEEVVLEAVKGGVTMVQLREKGTSTREFIDLARRLKEALKPFNVPLIINDRVDVALAIDADGVHVGQSDMAYEDVRRMMDAHKIIGLSVENMDDLRRANEWDVDYVGISPVFATPTKTDTSTPFGLEGLKEAVRISRHPTVAIGGMNLYTAPEVMQTGCDGIAVVSAILVTKDPYRSAKELKNIVETFKSSKKYPRVLTIAGSDSGGGAGVQADIKAISAMGGYATSVITAVTVQNTLGVKAVHPVPTDILAGQIDAVLSDIGTDAVKIGMLHSAEVVNLVANKMEEYDIRNVVLDPVMVSTSGHHLIDLDAIEVMKRKLVPLCRIITPNIPEAEILAGCHIGDEHDLHEVAKRLADELGVSILLKAGHLTNDVLVDYLFNVEDDTITPLPSERVETRNTHGTGCTLSSALATCLARGESLTKAVQSAKDYITKAILEGANYTLGNGHGPVCHFFHLP